MLQGHNSQKIMIVKNQAKFLTLHVSLCYKTYDRITGLNNYYFDNILTEYLNNELFYLL